MTGVGIKTLGTCCFWKGEHSGGDQLLLQYSKSQWFFFGKFLELSQLIFSELFCLSYILQKAGYKDLRNLVEAYGRFYFRDTRWKAELGHRVYSVCDTASFPGGTT